MKTANTGALKGLRVIEMGQLIAGPFCGQLLGDMGAEVIKIEPPGKGDPMREWGRGDQALWWEIIARNKKSVSLNLRTESARELLRKLLVNADILVENFRPGTLEKWGLAPANLLALNPRLIITRVSGYGQTGPYSDRPGFGGIAEAMGGWRYVVGNADRAPSRMGISIGDSLAASTACMGTLAALQHRHNTGQGQVVDTSLYESVLQVMESLVPDYAVSGFIRERSGSILPGIAPSNVYNCSDGSILIGANQDSLFTRLCAAMGEPEMAQDARYVDHLARGRNQTELDQRINAWTEQHTVVEVEALMLEHAIPAGRMYRAPEMLEDAHFCARESILEVEHPRWGTLPMQNVFPKLSASPGSVRSLAPATPGQDNDAVLGGLLAMSAEALAKLHKDGCI